MSLFFGGPPDTGWTFYVPFSVSTKTNVSATLMAAFILGMSSMLTGLNFITTIHRMRVKGMRWLQIPLFTWSLYATAWVQLLATPILSITLLLVLFERLFAIGLFDASKGGDPILYQHLFWMYSHPAVYIMILPGMGVISEFIPVFSRKSIFGYKAIVASSMAIAIAGSLVWAHHMFTSGMSEVAVFVFSLLTFLVAIPSAVKIFSWVSTMYKGSIQMTPPLLFALGFIYLFSVGGLTGLVLGAAGTNIHVHDTHFVVAHFHFVMFGGKGGKELSLIFGAVNTVILLISSFAVAASITAFRKKSRKLSAGLIAVAVMIGGIFLVNKYIEWGQKIHHGIYPNAPDLVNGPPGKNIFFGLYYIITGLHGLHIMIGMAMLSMCVFMILTNRMHEGNDGILENCGLYWHMVDIIWIFIFPLLYLIV